MRAARRAAIAGSWKLDIPIEEILSYTGTMEIVHENNADWYIKLTSSGTLTLTKDVQVDAFLVGAGGGGRTTNDRDGGFGGGGGGYIVLEKDIPLAAGDYPVTVGNSASSGFGFTADAGSLPPKIYYDRGGPGGTVGGAGGKKWGGNGADGKNGQFAFKDSAYASLGYFGSSGGGGGAANAQQNTPGAGGAGGAGAGNGGPGGADGIRPGRGHPAANYGCGGGGAGGRGSGMETAGDNYASCGYGFQGIVMIRNKR